MTPDPRTKQKPPKATPSGESRFSALIRSAYADSLEQLAGKPSAYQYGVAPVDVSAGITDPGQQALGQYTFHSARGQPNRMGADTVTLSPRLMGAMLGDAPRPADEQRDRTSPEYALAHELGHRSRIVAAMATGGPRRSAVRQEQDSVFTEADVDGRVADAPSDAYWPTNKHEHQAEAFANGVQYLRATAGQRAHPDQLARMQPTMNRYEQAVPGTGLMVQRLLAHPLYANHPIARAMQPQRPAADATAVRRPTPRPR